MPKGRSAGNRTADPVGGVPLQRREQFEEVVAALGRELADGPPGPDAMASMTPGARRWRSAAEALCAGARLAAAMVLLYPDRDGHATVPLTVRPADLPRHGGQVSLPGGGLDPGESPESAAVREFAEEMGAAPSGLVLLGRLSPLYIRPSDFVLQPILAACRRRPAFHPSPDEVAAVVEVALDALVGDEHRRLEWRSDDGRSPVPYYLLDGNKVWGATAMVLAELAVLREAAGRLGSEGSR